MLRRGNTAILTFEGPSQVESQLCRHEKYMFEPAYLKLLHSGELSERVRAAYQHLESCDLCGHHCGVNRRETTKGTVCRTGERALVSSYNPHFGEEPPLVGYGGSGTIFFAWCSLRCQYCQNFEISQAGEGAEVEPENIAAMMLRLQARGCHNVNLVTPSHVVAPILAATLIAAQAGLQVPLVYNTGGYDSLEALALLDGIVDIYMPDCKYADETTAHRYSKIRNYSNVNRAAVKEMHRQAGDLRLDERGIAERGLLVRHLVLPDNLAGTDAVCRWLAQEISPNTFVNIMDQYYPYYKAKEYPELNRRIAGEEFERALQWVAEAGLGRLA